MSTRTLLLTFGMAALALLAIAGAARPVHAATEVSQEAGIYEVNHTWGAYVHDYDNDGWEDVLINRHYGGTTRLYHNNGGIFTEVQAGTFGLRDRHDCAWADVNRDGREDVYCSVGGKRGGMGPNANELWVQGLLGGFTDRAKEYGVRDLYGRGRDVTFIDANGDPWPDLYVGNSVPRLDGRRGPNRLFINIDGQGFRKARAVDPLYKAVVRPIGGEVVQAADYDGDGWEDLLVCGQRRLYLFRNDHGRFRNVSNRTGANRPCVDAILTRVNRGRRLDLVRVRPTFLDVRLSSDTGFERRVFSSKLTRGMAISAGDINRDNRQDLYVVQSGPADADNPDLMLANRFRLPHGPSFAHVPIPQTTEGSGQSVATIDYDNNGFSDFIVMNGHRTARGPIRLVAFP